MKDPSKRIVSKNLVADIHSQKRKFEIDINCLNSTGLPAPLARISRVPKHDTSKLIPDDGFNEKATTNKIDLADPSKRAIKSKPILSMIHKYNIAELSLVDRPVKGPATGFGSIVDMHPKDHNKVYAETSNGVFFGARQPLSAYEVKAKFS
jgi:hypothetical protein